VVLAANRVSPGQTGSSAEIVGLISQSGEEFMQALQLESLKPQVLG
jgi:hypothetical protein